MITREYTEYEDAIKALNSAEHLGMTYGLRKVVRATGDMFRGNYDENVWIVVINGDSE